MRSGGIKIAVLALAISLPAAAQQFNDTLWHEVFNGTDLSNWKPHTSHWSIRYAGTDTAEILASGNTSFKTYLIWPYLFEDMEFEVVSKVFVAGNNSGIQFRSRCTNAGDNIDNACGNQHAVCGPQADLGNTHNGELYEECFGPLVNVSTQNNPPDIITTVSACRGTPGATQPGTWNTTRLRVVGSRVVGWLNGSKCYEFTLNKVEHLNPGIFALQYHTPSYTSAFRSIRVKNLSATPIPVADAGEPIKGFHVRGFGPVVSYSVRETGSYVLNVTDIRGNRVHRSVEKGPVEDASVALPVSGIYFVELTSANGSLVKKVVSP